MIRTVIINKKSVKQILRVCSKCGSKDWVNSNKSRAKTLLCANCSRDRMRFNNPIQQDKYNFIEQDEEKNKQMIDEFLTRRAL